MRLRKWLTLGSPVQLSVPRENAVRLEAMVNDRLPAPPPHFGGRGKRVMFAL